MRLTMDELNVIKELEKLSENDLVEQIRLISLAAWNKSLETITLKSWLNNFSGECLLNKQAERNLALWLALNFVFYTDKDIRSLSVNLWWKFIHSRLEEYDENGFLNDKTIYEKYEYIVRNTVIQPLGNCGGSGTNVCYFLRQSNGLKKEMFETRDEEKYEYLVLVDDATVSGLQANEYLEQYKSIDNRKKHILTFISTVNARLCIDESIDMVSAIQLDEKSKCFDKNSYVFFSHKNWTNIARKMCNYYGKKIYGRNPLGFKNGQYLFGFYYNIPNNTLPIFWSTNQGWTPLFNRYFSDYNKMEENYSEKFL